MLVNTNEVIKWTQVDCDNNKLDASLRRYVRVYRCNTEDLLAYYITNKALFLCKDIVFKDIFSNLENNYGVYVLMGEKGEGNPNSSFGINEKKAIYVGLTTDVNNDKGMGRLRQHNSGVDKYEDNWSQAIFITTINNSMNTATVTALESRLIQELMDMDDYEILNTEEEKASLKYIDSNNKTRTRGNLKEAEFIPILYAIKDLLSSKFDYTIYDKETDKDAARVANEVQCSITKVASEQSQNQLSDEDKNKISLVDTIKEYSNIKNKINNAVKEYKDKRWDEDTDNLEDLMTYKSTILGTELTEVLTPGNIAESMVNLIPAKCFTSDAKILCIGCKSGQFPKYLLKRYMSDDTQLPINQDPKFSGPKNKSAKFEHIIKNIIYILAVSDRSYLLTIKILIDELNRYKSELYDTEDILVAGKYILPNIKYMAHREENLFMIKHEYYMKRMINTLFGFNKDVKNDKDNKNNNLEVNNMKFDVVIGNPPYQDNIGNMDTKNKGLATPIFTSFIQRSIELGDNVVLITPSRWFTGNGQDGSFPKVRQLIKEHNHISKIVNYPDAGEVFPNQDIKGGVSYFLYRKDFDGNKHAMEFINIENGVATTDIRPLFIAGQPQIISKPIDIGIMKKVILNNSIKFEKLKDTTGRDPFGISGKESNVIEIVMNSTKTDAILISKGFEANRIDSDYISNSDLYNSYKVIISKSAGDPQGDRKVIGNPYIGEPGVACTDTYITIGKFKDRIQAENLAKYIKTKFLRYMVSILKISQNTYQIVYQFVPNQDFTAKSDIDWGRSIQDIDKQLYTKYNLSKQEIDYIENNIAEMV